MKKQIIVSVLFLISLGLLFPQLAAAQGYGGNYGGNYGQGGDSKPTVIYVIIKRVTLMGDTSFSVKTKDEIKIIKDKYVREAKCLSKAVVLVKKEWEEEKKDIPFPRVGIRASSLYELKNFTDKKKADEAIKVIQEKWDKLEEKKKEALEKKLAKLDEEARKKYNENQELQSQALRKISEKVNDLVAEMIIKEKEKKSKKK